MGYKCMFEGVKVASSLGFPLLYSSRGRKKIKASGKILRMKALKSSEIGVCRSDIAGITDVIVVGAGVAGSALAYALGKDGWRIHLIERNLTEPNRIVGELLHPGGYMKLKELGLEDCVDGIDAQGVFGCVLYMDGKKIIQSYPSECFSLDVTGRSFHNGRFIQKMRKKAASLPNIRLEQGTVTSLLEENGTIKGVRYKTKTGQELAASAPLTIVEIPSYFVGLVLENCVLSHANHGHFILNDTPILFYPISDNEIRCLVDVPGHKVPSISNGEMTDYLKTEVAPQIPIELYNAFICAIDKGDIRTMPNRIMPVSPCATPGAFLIGDALNMRHSLAGEGMTVALSDTVLLRDLLRPLNDLSDAAALYKYLESFYILRKPMASAMNIVAAALYTIFSATKDPVRNELKQACFNYFCLRGVFSNGLMALVAGINPNPLSLTFHCFAFSVYVVGRILLPFPAPKRIWIGAKLILDALGFLLPIMKAEGIRATFFPVTMPAYYRTPPPQSIDDFETRKL